MFPGTQSHSAFRPVELTRSTQSQPGQIVCETLSQKNPPHERAGGVAQGLGPEFNSQYWEKKKKKVVQVSLLYADLNSSPYGNTEV
jgi:hypothetical protein